MLLKEPKIVILLILIFLGLICRIINLGFSISFFMGYAKYATKYKSLCEDVSEDHELCIISNTGDDILNWGLKCSIFKCEKSSINCEDSWNTPLGYYSFFLCVGMLEAIILFFGRVIFEIIWIKGRINGKVTRKFRSIGNIVYIVLDFNMLMHLFPLYLYRFDQSCIRSLKDYDPDDYKEQNENCNWYFLLIFIIDFFMLTVPSCIQNILRKDEEHDICIMITFLILCIGGGVLFTHRSWVSRWEEHKFAMAFLCCMWIIYIGEIVLLYLRYYIYPQREPSESQDIPAIIRPPIVLDEIDGNLEHQPAAPEKVNLSMGDEERESFSISNEYIEEEPMGRGNYVEHYLEDESIETDRYRSSRTKNYMENEPKERDSELRINRFMENQSKERDNYIDRPPSAPELRINRFMENQSKERDNYIDRPPSAPELRINRFMENQSKERDNYIDRPPSAPELRINRFMENQSKERDNYIDRPPSAPELRINRFMENQSKERDNYIDRPPSAPELRINRFMENQSKERDNYIDRPPSAPELRINRFMENQSKERDNYIDRPPSAPELRINRFMENQSKERDNYIDRPPSAPELRINRFMENQSKERDLYRSSTFSS